MSGKKKTMTRFCRIFQWLEDQDAELAEAIHNLCLEGALSPGRSGGVTFLYPKDKAYRAEIISKTYSDEADEASKMVESLIVPIALIAGADFNSQAVGNRLGVKLVVESAEGSKVKLAGGIELSLAEDFQTLSRRAGDIAVWIVTKGRLPLEGEAFKAPSGDRKKGRGVAGGARGGGIISDRAVLATSLEGEFDRCQSRDRCAGNNPYLAKVVSLLNFLRAKHPEVFTKVLPMLDFDPIITFYLLFEPYKTSGDYIIPDSIMFGDGGWNGSDLFSNAVFEYEGMFRALELQNDGAFVFRDHAGVASQIDSQRQALSSSSNPRGAPPAVQEVYAKLASDNSIGGMRPILPESTLAALGGLKKLWQDELRFIIREALQTLRTQPYSTSDFAAIVRDLRAKWPGNNYADEIVLSNLAYLKTNVAPRSELLLLLKFVNSTDFLYVPVTPEQVGARWGSMNPTEWEGCYNGNLVALNNLRRTTGMVRGGCGLSPQTMQELELYKRTNGRLPDEVVAMASSSQQPAQ
jgi:hypothetical protein